MRLQAEIFCKGLKNPLDFINVLYYNIVIIDSVWQHLKNNLGERL